MDTNRNWETIYFPGKDGERVHVDSAADEVGLVVNEFHGDHDIEWLILMRNGVEVARYNARYLESIVWETDDPNGS